jgi:hypothetical protein
VSSPQQSTALRWGLVTVVALLLLAFAALIGFLLIIPALIEAAPSSTPCGTPAPGVQPVAAAGQPTAGFTPEQLTNAATIMQAAADHGFDLQGQTLAVTAALGESGLVNIAHGDRVGPDSTGLFQQRNPWGTREARMDPYQAATMFLTGGQGGQPGLDDVPNWQLLPPSEAIHRVQRNADPNHYTRYRPQAEQVVAALGGELPPSAACPPAGGQPVGPGGWTAPAIGTLSSGFGPRWGTNHWGQDIANTCGTPIYAAAAGTVISSGPASGYGNWIRIDHGGGVVTIYGHMAAPDLLVRVGDTVTAGQLISKIGSEGQSTGCHLHLQIEVDGAPVDPIPFLAQHDVALAT